MGVVMWKSSERNSGMDSVSYRIAAAFLSMLTMVSAVTADNGDMTKHVVMIHAETRPQGIEKFFPAIVLESTAKKSVLVSVAWGAEPFPIGPNGKAIDAIHLLDSKEPVEIVAFDEALGVAVFSVNIHLEPWPSKRIGIGPLPGEELEELILDNRHFERKHDKKLQVKTIDSVLPYKTARGSKVNVEGTMIFDGQTAGGPGTVLLRDGMLAAVFLNNEPTSPLTHHALPIKLFLSRCQSLIKSK